MKEIKENNNNGSVVVVTESTVTLYGRLKGYFNDNTTFPKIKNLSKRQRMLLDLAVMRYGEERVKECFRKAEQSDFLSGRKGCEWSADFDWIIKPNNIEGILNGKYDDFKYDKPTKPTKPTEPTKPTKPTKPTEQNTLSSFSDDEFIEAALARGFND